MDGLIAAELAANGLEAALTVFDAPDGLFPSLLQDPAALPSLDGLGEQWEILRNAFKPYAACQLTHASIDAARQLASKLKVEDIAAVRARVSPMAAQIANKTRPTSPTEGKFSLAYCVASALSGHAVAAADFSPARIADAGVQALGERVAVLPTEGIERWGAELEVELRGGAVEQVRIPVALGSPGNPMGWPDLERKFIALAEPVVGPARARALLALLQRFEQLGDLDELGALLGRSTMGAAAE
jgi:2-methylcitrate dehydratase PrpD